MDKKQCSTSANKQLLENYINKFNIRSWPIKT